MPATRSMLIPVSKFYAEGSANSPLPMRIELHEHEGPTRIALRREIHVHFRTRTAWNHIVHNPKIFLSTKGKNVNIWIEQTSLDDKSLPIRHMPPARSLLDLQGLADKPLCRVTLF